MIDGPIRVDHPVRACLSGEDLDWLGGRAVCVALDLVTTVEVNGPTGSTDTTLNLWASGIWAFLRERFEGLDAVPPAVTVSSRAPSASGLSSSTAVILGLVEALTAVTPAAGSVSRDDLVEWAYEYEFTICNGGGMDQLAITLGGATAFDGRSAGLPQVLGHRDFPPEWSVVVVDSGTPKSTPHHIRSVRAQQARGDRVLAQYVERCDATSAAAWAAIEARDLPGLTDAMSSAHEAMRDLQGMSTPLLETLRSRAEEVTGLPLKISGAGSGGALVGVCAADVAPDAARMLRAAYAGEHPDARVIVTRAAVACPRPDRSRVA